MSGQKKLLYGSFITNTINQITTPDQDVMNAVQHRWDSIAKPLRSLGTFEKLLTKIAGCRRSETIRLSPRTLVVFCADNGIVAEGVSQTGQDVTAKVAVNLTCRKATAAILCRETGTDILPVDAGMITDVGIRSLKTAYGTKNFALEDAMSYDDAVQMIESGISLAGELKEKGNELLLIGEMGIGNTSTSSAVSSVLLGIPVEEITGRGAGLSDEALVRKREILKRALEERRPDPADPVGTLAKVGGFDLAGMCGLILGAAANDIPVVLDGFMSAVGALAAVRLCPAVREYLIPSHRSDEPGANIVLEALGLNAPIAADMRPGEGCGAVMLMPVLDMVLKIYQEMPTFDAIDIDAYELFDKA